MMINDRNENMNFIFPAFLQVTVLFSATASASMKINNCQFDTFVIIEVVIMTTCSATSEDKVVKLVIFFSVMLHDAIKRVHLIVKMIQ